MTFNTKMSILKNKIAVRYNVNPSDVIINHAVSKFKEEPTIISIRINGKGRITQPSSKEIDSINNKINLYNTILIIERFNHLDVLEWTIAVYLPFINDK